MLKVRVRALLVNHARVLTKDLLSHQRARREGPLLYGGKRLEGSLKRPAEQSKKASTRLLGVGEYGVRGELDSGIVNKRPFYDGLPSPLQISFGVPTQHYLTDFTRSLSNLYLYV